MRVSSLLNTAGDPAAAGGDGAGIPHPPGRLCRDPRPAGGRGGRADCRGWVACGCGNATGWVQVLRDPRLAKAIYAMHQRPGSTGKWKIWRGRRVFHARCSRNVFSPPPAPPPPAISPSCVCGWRCSTSPMKAGRWKRSPSASGISRWRPSAGLSNASPASRREPCAPRHARVSLYVKRYTPLPTRKRCPLSAGLATRNTSSVSWLAAPSRKINCRPPTSSPCSPVAESPAAPASDRAPPAD